MERVVVENVYIDGDPNGIVVSSMRMSPITAFVIPRNLLSIAKKIENINNLEELEQNLEKLKRKDSDGKLLPMCGLYIWYLDSILRKKFVV